MAKNFLTKPMPRWVSLVLLGVLLLSIAKVYAELKVLTSRTQVLYLPGEIPEQPVTPP